MNFTWNDVDNFSKNEFACSHCGKTLIQPYHVLDLQKIREKFGAMIIGSGYRCREHNKEVDGADYSMHTFGVASDIYFLQVNWENPNKVLELLKFIDEMTYVGRIGLYSWGLHLDHFNFPPYEYWYKDKNRYHGVDSIEEMVKKFY